MVKRDGILFNVQDKDIELLKSNPKEFWKGVSHIFSCAFSKVNVEEVIIPSHVNFLFSSAFSNNKNIKKVVLSKSIKSIPENCFENCNSLSSIDLPNSIEKIEENAFKNCKSLTEVKLPDGIKEIASWAFSNCSKLKKINIPKSLKKIRCFTFYETNIEELIIPEKVEKIEFSVAKNNSSLKKVVLHNGIEDLDINAFDLTAFSFAYVNDKNRVVIAKELPDNETCTNVLNLKLLRESTNDMSFNSHFLKNEKMFKCFSNVFARNQKHFKYINQFFLQHHLNEINYDYEYFLKNYEFKFFANEVADFKRRFPEKGIKNNFEFCYFAYLLGCFSKEKVKDKFGNETDVLMCQKASSLLVNLYKVYDFDIYRLKSFCVANLIRQQKRKNFPNYKALNSIAQKNGNKYENFDTLYKLEKQLPGITKKVLMDFDKVCQFKTIINSKGKPENVSWEMAIRKYNADQKYGSISEKNIKLAEVFSEKNIDQLHFERALEILQQAEKNGVPHHILNKPLKEMTILEKIEKFKQQTCTEIYEAGKFSQNAFDKQFTYEWLDKYDSKNFILGCYCSCCATISSELYGARIARDGVIAPDVQNLVVKDVSGVIIAKGTIYVNKQYGYAVINDFELNSNYRKHEDFEEDGIYNVAEYSKGEIARQKIFDTFMRGVKTFVEEYNKQNTKKLTKINVGFGHNRLKAQLGKFKKEKELLKVPDEYKFYDASSEQYILYEKQ